MTRIPLLIATLKQVDDAVAKGGMDEEETRRFVEPIAVRCREQIGDLEELIGGLVPREGESRVRRAKKAMAVVGCEGRVREIARGLGEQMHVLTSYVMLCNQSTTKRGMSF
ncbi:hypothetical protein K402DRAFT_204153 [Aulographum hederae CBS 113979]|uniref:NACHT-NTPase and P-loop NTPases N-terminal domain-containing protein n=1 Tax=Aulographum hederae CBS 113979 TaxID=1176131 RepID=A0A6G1HCS4_9PEZI|nr:hypothetical protein K402DRAFT_204153 [Aulographum hederae CBS 113979]